MADSNAPHRLVVLFDADCGVCSWSATGLDRLDRHHRLRLLPLQEAATALDDAPPHQVLVDRLHVRDDAGRW